MKRIIEQAITLVETNCWLRGITRKKLGELAGHTERFVNQVMDRDIVPTLDTLEFWMFVLGLEFKVGCQLVGHVEVIHVDEAPDWLRYCNCGHKETDHPKTPRSHGCTECDCAYFKDRVEGQLINVETVSPGQVVIKPVDVPRGSVNDAVGMALATGSVLPGGKAKCKCGHIQRDHNGEDVGGEEVLLNVCIGCGCTEFRWTRADEMDALLERNKPVSTGETREALGYDDENLCTSCGHFEAVHRSAYDGVSCACRHIYPVEGTICGCLTFTSKEADGSRTQTTPTEGD